MDVNGSGRISSLAARVMIGVCFAARLAQGAGLPAFNIEERTTAPLLVADQPWESRSIGFLNVIETNGAWKCWYASIDTNYASDDDQLYCYATSSNGVDWVKPNLGRVTYNGSTDNNLVLRGGGAGAYVFWDPSADRYRMTSIRYVSGNFVVFGKDSSNGLDWVEYPNPIFPHNADTQNACLWDVDRYRLYPRMWTGGIGTANSFRMVGYSESTTFSNFPAPTVILATDALDPPKADFYNSAATKLADNLYVMFPSAYYDLDNGATGVGVETVVPHMAVSTNGVNFVKVGHAPAVPLGGSTDFDRASIYVGPGCVPGPRPNTWWFHYVGLTNKHNQVGSFSGGLGRFLLTVLPEEDGGAVPLPYKSGLMTWLRADDLDADRNVTNNPADGTPVALWKDSNNAAAGYHAAQNNAAKQPRYRTAGGPNSMPRVEFDGTNDFLELPTMAYSNWTVFIVGRMAAGPSGTALAFADYGPAGASYPFLALYRAAGAFTPYNRDRTSHTIRADDTNGWNRFAIRSAWVGGEAVNYRVTDGSNTYAGAGTPAAGFAAAAMSGDLAPTLGDLPPATGAYAANLELSEFLLFDHTLSPADRAAVEDYLKVKYYPESTNPTPPTASFSASPLSGTVPLAVDFSDVSTGTITNRAWDFGDGHATNTTAAVLAHTYTNIGNYTVTLTASGPLGTNTLTRTEYISVLGLPLYWGSGGTRFNIEERTTAPLMVADRPWESRTLGFLNVLMTNDAWHCWYAAIDTNYAVEADQIYCYATSSNGLDWVKPNLGRVSYNGSTDNNIVLRGGGAGGSVFWDPAAQRYRMTVIRLVSGNYVVFGKDSSNGLDWVEYPTPIFPYNADTQNACMWDVDRYRFYPRMWTGGVGTPNSFRLVGYSESTSFTNFPAPSVLLAPNALDPPKVDFYNSAATKLADGLYVMFPSAFYSLNNGATGESAETVVPHMAASMNGRDFDKIGHAPAVPLGGPDRFDRGSIYVGPGCVPGPRPNTWWFYYVGNVARHNQVLQGFYKGGLGRFLLTVLPEADGGAVPLTQKEGLLTWLRADDLDADRNVTNNPTDGTPVARWKDSHNAAAGYHGNQTNTVRQPLYRTSGGPNNMPMVEFDGTNDFLELPTIAYSTWTVFMVGRIPTGPVDASSVAFSDYGPVPAGGNSFPFLAMFRAATTAAYTPYNRDGTSHTIRADDAKGWTNFAIRSAWVTSSAVNYKVTDATNGYTGAGTPGAGYTPVSFQGDQPPCLGALPPFGINNANMELCEFLLYDRTLSTFDRTAVEDYLKEKYYPADTNPAPPTASFTASPTSGSAPLAVTFTDTSTGTITNRSWSFGDGQTTNTTQKVFLLSYPTVGTYTVTLTASGPLGTSTVTRAGYIAVQGRPLYWDSDGATAGGSAGTTAPGTWGGDAFWNTASAGGAGTFLTTTTTSDDLYFSAGTDVTGASLVTITGTQTAASLTVQEGSITLTGGVANVPAVTITGANSALRVTANDTLGGVAGNVINLAGGGNTTPCRLSATVGGLVLPNNLTWNGYSALGSVAVAPFTLTGAVTMKGNVTLQPDSGSSAAVLGNIGDEGAGRNLTLFNNQGTLTLRLAGDNTFSGDFVYDARVSTTLELGRDTAFGVGLVKSVGNLNTGTLKAVDAGFGSVRTYANHVQFAHIGGSCTLAFDGSHTFNGQATLNGTGRFQVNANGTLALPNGLAELGGPRTLTLVGGGAGNRLLIGAVPAGMTNYAVLATVPANNTVIAAGNHALGTNLATTVFTAGSTLGFSGDVDYAAPKAITIGGAGPAGEGSLGAIRNFSGNNSFAGPITLSAATTVTNDAGNLTLNGVITDGAGTFGLTHNGGGTLALGNANTYDGVTTIKGGVLRLNDATALPGGIGAAGGTSALTLAGGVLGLGTNGFSRALGTGIAQVQWTTNGGFAAYGADRAVNLGNAWATVVWSKSNFVPTNSALLLSAADATHLLDFQNPINLTNAVRTVHVADGAAAIDARLSGVISSTVAASGGLIKTGAGTLQVTATNTYTGLTRVDCGTLLADGAQSGAFAVASNAVLGGVGSVGAVSGAGLVSPGASAGILTASQLDPTDGLDFAFEFTAPGSPDYANPGASSNDVLRLTNAATPFAAPLTGTNVVHVYLNVSSLSASDTFRGAWYTDNASLDFLGDLTNATFRYYVRGDGLSGANTFNGVYYYTLSAYNPWMSVTVSRINEDGSHFSGADGFITQFGIALPRPPGTIFTIR